MTSRIYQLGPFLLIFFVANVIAFQASASDVKNCLKIKGDLDRLACYDNASGYIPKVTAYEGVGKWQVSKSQSKIDDSTNVTLALHSEEETNCKYKDENTY